MQLHVYVVWEYYYAYLSRSTGCPYEVGYFSSWMQLAFAHFACLLYSANNDL